MYNRTQQKNIEKNLFKGKTIILYGARQVGKTTLVKNILKKSTQKSKYIDCDLLENRLALQTESAEKLKKFLGDYSLIVLDEAQRIKNIGLNLKIIHDNFPEIQIIATGSSSFDLSNQINEPLTGRTFEYTLFPLSVGEIMEKYDYAILKSKLENVLRFGCYPDIFDKSEEESQKNLAGLTSNYLYKDILEFENLKKSDQLVNLLRLLAFQIGSEVSYSEIGRQLKLNVLTVQKYIDLLEKSFVIFRLTGFSRNLRKEIAKNVKIYFWDLGIRNALIQNFNPFALRNDQGALWENFFIAERLKFLSNQQKFANSYFWRTYDQKKIDYLEEAAGELKAFECKWNPQKKVKPPKDFLQTYAESSFEIITPENFEEYLT